MTERTLNEALAVIEAARNFMAGLTLDPSIPSHAIEALAVKVDALDRYINEALGEDDD
jgi:hypothetical protein